MAGNMNPTTRNGMTTNVVAPQNSDRALLVAIARRAMIERGLQPDFPKAALEELKSMHAALSGDSSHRDLRDRLWVSIDNNDSRDLDQLTLGESLTAGRTRILVAVADVDALVRKDCAIDRHAHCNTTSVYTPAAIFPMLPEALSTGLTSLNEDQDRKAIVADMVFAVDGSLATSEIYPALVRNHAKLAYQNVAAWLDGYNEPPPRVSQVAGLADNLRLQDGLALKLASLRRAHGALSLETIEEKAVFTGEAISDLEPDEKNRAKQLIEEFMVAANGVTAIYLASKGFPSLRRVLRSPQRWDRIMQLAAGLGEKLPSAPDALALEGFLLQRRQADPSKFTDLSLAVVKLIGRGEYVLDPVGAEAPGHFGLAVKDYTHSTAPNRRFPDLITQRLLKAALSGATIPYSDLELTDLAAHCTAREDDATKVERRVGKSAAALLLSGKIGQRFEAIVTGASPKGTWVKISRPSIEGKLSAGFQDLDVGDRLQVKLTRTDVERGFIDFIRVA